MRFSTIGFFINDPPYTFPIFFLHFRNTCVSVAAFRNICRNILTILRKHYIHLGQCRALIHRLGKAISIWLRIFRNIRDNRLNVRLKRSQCKAVSAVSITIKQFRGFMRPRKSFQNVILPKNSLEAVSEASLRPQKIYDTVLAFAHNSFSNGKKDVGKQYMVTTPGKKVVFCGLMLSKLRMYR
jgi:hypothetical protein